MAAPILHKTIRCLDLFFSKTSFARVSILLDKMLALGIKTAPVLSVDGQMLQAAEAAKWINSQKVGQENGNN